MAQLLLIGHNLHGPAAQNKAGAHQHGIPDLPGSSDTVLNAGNGLTLWLGDVQGEQQLFKGVPVFRLFNGGAVGANDGYTPVGQRLGQVDGSLTAKGRDNALGLFQLHHVHHVLHRQRLKIQLVGGGIVRGDGLRVVVDDDGLIARVFNGLDRVDGGIVKFHALPDADGAGTEDDDLLLIRYQ